VAADQPEDLNEDYALALPITNDWWSRHWGEYFTGSYSPPFLLDVNPQLGIGLYDAPADAVFCGPVVLSDQNAYYCGPPFIATEDYLAFDVDFLNRAVTVGDVFIYMIVAHEWGHAIQARLDTSLRQVRYELQADCLAGAVIQGVLDDGVLVFEPGDNDEVTAGLTSVADAIPWGQAGDHGSAQERIDNYNAGVFGGVNACLAAG